MTSTSANSGRGNSLRRSVFGRAETGTSGWGKVTPVRPGDESSNMVGSTTIGLFTGIVFSVMVDLLQNFDQEIDLFPGVHFCNCDQHMILEGGIILSEIVTTHNAMFEQMCIDLGHRFWAAYRKLMKERCIKAQIVAFEVVDLFGGIVSFVVACLLY